MSEESRPAKRRPLISHDHQKRSLTVWIVPLVVVIAVMVLLPKIMGLIGG